MSKYARKDVCTAYFILMDYNTSIFEMLLDKIINKIKFINYTYYRFYDMMDHNKETGDPDTRAQQNQTGGRIWAV